MLIIKTTASAVTLLKLYKYLLMYYLFILSRYDAVCTTNYLPNTQQTSVLWTILLIQYGSLQ